MSITTQRAETIASAKAVAARAQDQGRNLTASECDEITAAVERVKAFDARIARAKDDAATLASITGADRQHDGATGSLRLAGPDAKALAGSIAARMLPDGSKQLLSAGAVVNDVTMAPSPVSLGYAAFGLLDVLPAVQTSPVFSYLRQTTRTNNAGVVAPGATKATSIYGLTRIENRLKVVAHISEKIDRFWLEDSASLERFISDEMLYGLARAVEQQVLSGAGTGEEMTGLANLSGVQVQAHTTSPILTCRAALTKVEALYGTASGWFAMNPADFEKIETSTLSAGNFVLADANQNVPVNSAARRLWGQPVYATVALAPGTGYFVNNDALALNTDGALDVRWSESSGTDFETNSLRCRVEGRYEISAYRPSGVVRLALAAPTV